ncbi:MAG: isoprenylcysteine carboxylmethyltransferase family protein [Flavobacteriales bacterium]
MLLLLLSLVLFYGLHSSALAWNGVKQWAAQAPGLDRWYRLSYSLLSTLLAGWVVHRYVQLPFATAVPHTPLVLIGGWALIVIGAAIATAAVLRFGGAGFLGFVPEADTGLVRSGMHSKVRHPIYSGIILAALGWLLLSFSPPTMLVVGVTFAYLPIGIRLEEQKLIEIHGEAYLRYKAEVPALFPIR